MHQSRRASLARSGLALGAATSLAALTPGGSSTAHADAIGFAAPAVLQGGCGGEPSIDLDGAGHVYVSSPKGIGNALASCQGLAASTNGAATWVSSNGGTTFGGQIGVGTLNGGGDTDTTVDRVTGNVYVADLEAAAADICVSADHGTTYQTALSGAESCTSPFNITGQAGPSNDREWLNVYGPTAAYPHRDLYLTYHDFATGLPEIFTSRDGGAFVPSIFPAISDPAFASNAANGTVEAKPVLDAAGTIYQLYTTQAAGNGPLQSLYLVKSTDHGQTFTATQVFDGSSTHAALGLVFNDLAIDGAGNLYALVLGNTQGAAPPDNAYLFVSTDQGKSFAKHQVPTDGKALALAALHGGPLAGQLVMGFYHSTNTTDTNDVAGQWTYQALESTNATGASPVFTSTHLASASNPATGIVHQGQICTAGLNCSLATGPKGSGNRNLADFSSVTVDQHGCAIFAYPDDGKILADQSNFAFGLVSNDVGRQTRGCFATTTGRRGAALTAAPSEVPGTALTAARTVETQTLGLATTAAAGASAGGPAMLALLGAVGGGLLAVGRRRRR